MTARSAPAWAHVAGPFRGFEHRFAIAATDEALGHHLGDLWHACRDDVTPTTVYGLEVDQRDEQGTTYRLWVDAEVHSELGDPSIALRDLTRRINRGVVDDAGELVVIHAAGAVLDGKGVLFPGPSGSGKSTLVAHLVSNGWGYLSDEAVGIHPDTLELRAYQKPLSIKPGSWELLRHLDPRCRAPNLAVDDREWHIGPSAAAGSLLGSALALVLPVVVSGRSSVLRPLRAAAATARVADSCLSIARRPQIALETIARVCSTRLIAELEADDLGHAREVIERTVTSDLPWRP